MTAAITQQEQESEGILQSPAYHKRKPQRSDERSEERRVGKECRSRWAADRKKKKMFQGQPASRRVSQLKCNADQENIGDTEWESDLESMSTKYPTPAYTKFKTAYRMTSANLPRS